ncbi:hypothetical protein KSS87_003753 [Heliosperma pusillum]|nr:hypothetical protein KSS87_003753 [Heliosperma pusillum]
MEWNSEDLGFNDDLCMQHDRSQQAVITLHIAELERILVDDSSPPLYEERTHSTVDSNLPVSTEPPSPPNCNVELNNNHVGLPEHDPTVLELQSSDESTQKGGRRRTRGPEEAHDHIMAERKRRQLTAQLFVSLSAMLPGLKKMDKTTILSEAIKHMKQLKEKVEALEEVTSKQNVQSMVMVKKSKMVVDNDNDYDDSSCILEDNYVLGGGNVISKSVPEIEAMVSYKTLILNLYCEKQKGILPKIFGEMEKHGIIVLHCTVESLGNSVDKHTIVGQLEKRDKMHVKNLVVSLNSILHAL